MRHIIPIQLKLITYSEQAVITISFGIDAIADWVTGLCLLKEKLSDCITFLSKSTGQRLTLRQIAGPDRRLRAKVKRERFELDFTELNVTYLLDILLRYYRDGMAEVNHIDLDAKIEELDENGYVTLQFAQSSPPVNIEEARKRLEVD